MRAVITQPNYLPWLGYFEQIAQADIFVFLDDVQYLRNEWQNRNRLTNAHGDCFWLTVPIEKHSRNELIKNIQIASKNGHENWKSKHLLSIKSSLGKSRYFDDIFPLIEATLNKDFQSLSELNIELIKGIGSLLGLSPKFISASDLGSEGSRSQKLLNICKMLSANIYYTSLGAKVYLDNDIDMFHSAGIEVQYQHWEHPTYKQLRSPFVSHLSVIDALMHVGASSVRELIT